MMRDMVVSCREDAGREEEAPASVKCPKTVKLS